MMTTLLSFATVIAYHAVARTEPASSPRRIVLFGAHWCAPCRAELQALPALAAAAAPVPIVLAWIDRPPRTAFSQVPAPAARALAKRIAGDGYGLPFAALLDADGTPCAIRRGPLLPADVREFVDACKPHG